MNPDISCVLVLGRRFDTFHNSPLAHQPKTVAKKMVVQRMVFGSRLHEAPCMDDVGENERKRGNTQLLIALGSFSCRFTTRL